MQFSKIMLVSAGLALAAAQGFGFFPPAADAVTIQTGPAVVVTETEIETLTPFVTSSEQLSSRISKTEVVVQTLTNTVVDVSEVSLLPSVTSTNTVYALGTSTTMTTQAYMTTTASARIANEAAATTREIKYGYSTILFPTTTGNGSTAAAAAPMKTILPGMAAIIGGAAAFLA